jgi:Na+/melibiose symporter-like transporter
MTVLEKPLAVTDEVSRDALWRTVFLIAATAALGGVLGAVTYNKQLFLYKEVLGLSASAVGTLALIINLPAYLQPFMGGVSDLYPLFGWHRRTYFALAAVVQSLGYFGLMTLHHYHYAAIVCLLIVAGSGGALAGVLINAAMVSVGNRTNTFGPLQTLYQFTPLVLALVYTGKLDGQVTATWSYHHAFLTAGLVSLAFAPLAFLIEDRRVVSGRATPEELGARKDAKDRERAQTAVALREAARTPGIWAVTAFFFYLNVTPLLLTASVYYETDVLKLSKDFIGRLDSWTAAGSIAGLLAFGALSRKLPIRAIVWGAIISDCAIYLIAMTMHDAPSVHIAQFLWSFMAIFLLVCLNTLAARACPPKIEGTVYGLMQAAMALSLVLCDKFGSTLYDFFGPANHHSITHGWFCALWFGFGFTVLAVFFVPFLPAWAKEGHSKTSEK